MRRPLLVLVLALAGIGAFTGGLAWLLDTPRPPAQAPRVERLWIGLCATCHGVDGRGSWRAALFLIRPGDFSAPRSLRDESDQYLFDVIKYGGAPIGKPGMPAFGSSLSDADVEALVTYARGLGRPTGPPRR
ncbi:MAG: cytochrome c [Candidatus Rokubacteria bacterium]|nr:cytochrome c [Candidatus Rokubacteria bacterium]MBI3824554.1 cytochrome c [Candidatus Rokubacteria bacterium]